MNGLWMRVPYICHRRIGGEKPTGRNRNIWVCHVSTHDGMPLQMPAGLDRRYLCVNFVSVYYGIPRWNYCLRKGRVGRG